MEGRWMTTREAAALWSSLSPHGTSRRRLNDVTVRRMCREGVMDRLGIDCIHGGNQWLISRPSLLWHVWITAQDTCRIAEAACGIVRERTYEIIGRVGEEYHGDGQAMDRLWRQLMREEFERCGGSG